MKRTTPPFRADHVGSLLRTAFLKEARAQREKGAITDAELTTVENREIKRVIQKQESLGLQAATDGEYRRSFWHFDFLERLGGLESFVPEQGIQFKGGQTKAKALRVISKIDFSGHPMLEQFRFLKQHAKVMPKMNLPSPSVVHFRGGRAAVSKEVYPEMEEFYSALAAAYSKAVQAFAAEGCRYLQFDEVNLAYLCDNEQRENLRKRGDDPEVLPMVYARMINQAIAERPGDMFITLHLCRGNFRSLWIAQGGYEPVAEVLFNEINVNGYFLEWDTDRAGGFEPLRFVPKGKPVALGLVTTKAGTLESKDDLKRRIDQASKFVDLDQLCLCPQCGFASTEEGNILSEAEQWAKLERIVEVAGEVWG